MKKSIFEVWLIVPATGTRIKLLNSFSDKKLAAEFTKTYELINFCHYCAIYEKK